MRTSTDIATYLKHMPGFVQWLFQGPQLLAVGIIYMALTSFAALYCLSRPKKIPVEERFFIRVVFPLALVWDEKQARYGLIMSIWSAVLVFVHVAQEFVRDHWTDISANMSLLATVAAAVLAYVAWRYRTLQQPLPRLRVLAIKMVRGIVRFHRIVLGHEKLNVRAVNAYLEKFYQAIARFLTESDLGFLVPVKPTRAQVREKLQHMNRTWQWIARFFGVGALIVLAAGSVVTGGFVAMSRYLVSTLPSHTVSGSMGTLKPNQEFMLILAVVWLATLLVTWILASIALAAVKRGRWAKWLLLIAIAVYFLPSVIGATPVSGARVAVFHGLLVVVNLTAVYGTWRYILRDQRSHRTRRPTSRGSRPRSGTEQPKLQPMALPPAKA